jgi:hypothetical protein
MIAKLKFFLTHVDEAAGASCGGAEEKSLIRPVKLLFKPTLRAYKIVCMKQLKKSS